MRKWILALVGLVALTALAQTRVTKSGAFIGSAKPSSAACTTPATATFNEGFEGVNYENTGWTTNATGDVNPDYLDAPTGGCSQSFRVGYGGSAINVVRDFTSVRTNIGGSFWFKSVAVGGAAQKGGLVEMSQSAYFGIPFRFNVKAVGGAPELWLEGATTTNWTGLSLGTWYQVEFHGTNGGGTVWAKVNGANEKTITSGNNGYRYGILGSVTYFATGFTNEVDLIHINFSDAYP